MRNFILPVIVMMGAMAVRDFETPTLADGLARVEEYERLIGRATELIGQVRRASVTPAKKEKQDLEALAALGIMPGLDINFAAVSDQIHILKNLDGEEFWSGFRELAHQTDSVYVTLEKIMVAVPSSTKFFKVVRKLMGKILTEVLEWEYQAKLLVIAQGTTADVPYWTLEAEHMSNEFIRAAKASLEFITNDKIKEIWEDRNHADFRRSRPNLISLKDMTITRLRDVIDLGETAKNDISDGHQQWAASRIVLGAIMRMVHEQLAQLSGLFPEQMETITEVSAFYFQRGRVLEAMSKQWEFRAGVLKKFQANPALGFAQQTFTVAFRV